MPALAIEEEGRLNDPGLREHFVDRVFGQPRVRDFFAVPWTPESLIRFHSAEKAAVLAHDVEAARRLGRLVASHRQFEPEHLARSYRDLHSRHLRAAGTEWGLLPDVPEALPQGARAERPDLEAAWRAARRSAREAPPQ